MRLSSILLPTLAVSLLAASASAQHAQVSAVAVRPSAPSEVWVCNRDQGSVSVVDLQAGHTLAEIDVGQRPRSVAFTPDGSRAFVANQRGDVPYDVHFLTPFTGAEVRGSVSVVDAATRSVTATLTDVGVEPYGVAVAPNGKYVAVTTFRSGAVVFYDAQTLAKVLVHQYLAHTDVIPQPFTIADVDSDRDGVADLGEPRGFTIRSDSQRLYVTHHRSPFVSVLDVVLGPTGLPAAVTLAARIDTNTYPFHPVFNPVPVQTIQSQGLPRFLEDVALSPDGSLALVPHLLHNVNHDVNHDFGPAFPGDFANRVYPALTVIDASANSFAQPGDASRRLHNELADPVAPAEYASIGAGSVTAVGRATLGGLGEPVLGGQLTLQIGGLEPGDSAILMLGNEVSFPSGPQVATRRFLFPVPASGIFTKALPAIPALEGSVLVAQALYFSPAGNLKHYTNGVRVRLGSQGTGLNKLGHRAGHPSRVAFNEAGDRAVLLNRGSEDLFVYEVSGNDFRLMAVYPPRVGFVERAALDTTTPMGDLPLGMAIAPDPATANDDALVYVVNELTRTLSVLRVDWDNGAVTPELAQIPLLLQPDVFTASQRLGDELFEDASRAQTTGAHGTVGGFNNSCASCHFEGGEDANVWQRPNGPRSTMPVYQGSLMTGLILWKGVRLNMGETGPMFGGENGGTGILSDAEQQALIDAHETIPVPLNPNMDPLTGGLSAEAALGKDLFLGTNQTGLNPTLRRAGCADCHPDQSAQGQMRGFTADFIDPQLSGGETLQLLDPDCFSLQGNIVALNIRNVNSGVNIDLDGDGFPEPDPNADGYIDIETYAPMNSDKDDDFQRDDPNSWPCPVDPLDPTGPKKTFLRDARSFSIPTKLGVFSSAPYFHDHSALSLRAVVDPEAQALDPVYGDPAYGASAPQAPGLNKFFNEFHDVRGHEQFVQGASKVQINLQSTNVQADIEALLAFIRSL